MRSCTGRRTALDSPYEVQPLTDRIRVFVASSSEQLPIVHRVAELLDESDLLDIQPWEEDVFELSAAYIESLERELDRADFAVVILTADDSAQVRQKDVNLPRDNVVFELGLFIGRLGRERCLFFVDRDSETRIATDLSGVEPAYYSLADGDPAHGLERQVQRVVQRMERLKQRCKPTPEDRRAQEALWRFSRGLCGHWWERMRKGEDDKSALSYVTVVIDPVTNTPRLEATAYDLGDGRRIADWGSVSTGVALPRGGERAKLFYRWTGHHDNAPGQIYGGGGQIIFDVDLDSGRGEFYDTNYAEIPTGTTTRIKHFGLYRADPAEEVRMHEPWKATDLIVGKLGELSGR